MSNKPAPRCPGCGNEMELTEVSKHTWRYSCDDCGWRSPLVRGLGKEGKNIAYAKAMQRYRPEYDGYQGTTHEQGWPDQRMQTVFGGGEVRFDAPPGRYPLVCQSTRGTEQGHTAGQWISVKDRLPEHENEYLVCLDDGFIATTAWSDGEWELWADAGDVTHWQELPAPPKEEE